MRTTMMIRNVPNKMSKAALLKLINRRHAGTYDFFYLPIDSRNRDKCNLGYAFINFRDPCTIASFKGKRHANARASPTPESSKSRQDLLVGLFQESVAGHRATALTPSVRAPSMPRNI